MPHSGSRFPGIPNSSIRVLQISDDPGLATTRLLVLQTAGFKVEHRLSALAHANAAFRAFQVVILCQSIEARLAEELSRRICAEAPDARILRVRHGHPDQVLADVSITAPAEPHDLVKVVQTLAHSPGR